MLDYSLWIIGAIVVFFAGMVLEHKFDVITPERLTKAEAAIDEIRERLRKLT